MSGGGSAVNQGWCPHALGSFPSHGNVRCLGWYIVVKIGRKIG